MRSAPPASSGSSPHWSPPSSSCALTVAEIRARDPAAFEAWMADVGRFQFPEGESLADVSARAWPAFEEITARHPDSGILVVAHGGPNRIVLCRALGIRPERILALG